MGMSRQDEKHSSCTSVKERSECSRFANLPKQTEISSVRLKCDTLSSTRLPTGADTAAVIKPKSVIPLDRVFHEEPP